MLLRLPPNLYKYLLISTIYILITNKMFKWYNNVVTTYLHFSLRAKSHPQEDNPELEMQLLELGVEQFLDLPMLKLSGQLEPLSSLILSH